MSSRGRPRRLGVSKELMVKVLHPALAASLGTERFLREIEIAARLVHPHILSLLDSGEAHGSLYFVMPYAPGDSLRARSEKSGSDVRAMARPCARRSACALPTSRREWLPSSHQPSPPWPPASSVSPSSLASVSPPPVDSSFVSSFVTTAHCGAIGGRCLCRASPNAT